MYRIDNSTAITPIPTPAAVGPNPDYFFTNGNAGLGIPATIVDADWANAVQEEICNVITDAGTTLSKTVRTQLRDAIKLSAQAGGSRYAASTTAANTYTASLSPAPSAYTTGMVFFIKFTNANTGAATLNLNSLGAKSITHLDGTALVANDIVAGMIGIFAYDGTNLQLLNASTVTIANVQNAAYIYAASTTAANTYTATLSPAPTAYTAGMNVIIKFTNANTGAATINLNSLGAKSITLNDGTALTSGNIFAGMIAILNYDGTNFQLINPYLSKTGISKLGSGSNNVTGDGTVYLIPLPAASRDTGSEFNSGTHLLTASKAGIYIISCSIYMTGFTSSHTLGQVSLQINGSAPSAYQILFNPWAMSIPGGSLIVNYTVPYLAAAGDTIGLALVVANGTKVVSTSTPETFMGWAFMG